MKSYSTEFKQPRIYFDQSITSDKYSLLRFIIYYYYYSITTCTKNNKGDPMDIDGRDHILMELFGMRKEYSTDLHTRILISLDQRIETYHSTLKKRTKTDAIKKLLEIGLFTFENWSQIKKEPNKLEELYKQMKEGELVDSIQGMDQLEFEIMFDIFKTECKASNFISSIAKEMTNG